MGAQRSLLFYGEYSGDRVQIPVTCWLVKTTDGTILFDTGLSPRAVPGLMRNDPLARFTEEDLLVHRLDTLGLQAADVDLVVISHLHYDHAGGAGFFAKSELVVQQDEYSYAHHPAGFFAPFFRASLSPMAIACLRLLTFLPLRPLVSVPRFFRRIALFTIELVFLPYVRFRAMSTLLCKCVRTRTRSSDTSCKGHAH